MEKTILDKSKPLENYWHNILLDENGNMGVVYRRWTGDWVKDKEPSYGQFGGLPNQNYEELNKLSYSYHYENVQYHEAYIRSLIEEKPFDSTGELIVIGTIRGTE